MQIPGRVGYQCSNYYRSLILKVCCNGVLSVQNELSPKCLLQGEIVDPNYVLTEDGKLEFLFKTKASKSGGSDGVSVTPRRTSSAGACVPSIMSALLVQVFLCTFTPPQPLEQTLPPNPSGRRRQGGVIGMNLKTLSRILESRCSSAFLDHLNVILVYACFFCSEMASLEYFESSVANLGPSVLKGFIDPITSREVVMPAMSPQGYVMG